MSARDKFLALLRDEILQMDLSELDFGLYRILNYKRGEVARFLDNELPAAIARRLAALPGTSGEDATEDEEARIYNALTVFFSRYFVDADFMPRARRGKHAAYSVPYRGEDTHFHWASKGSHYIKSGERFAAYAYVEPAGRRVRFVVAAADVQKDNAKGDKRLYVPVGGSEVDGEWRIACAWRPLDKDENKRYGSKSKDAAAEGDEADAGEDANDAAAAATGRDTQTRLLNAWLAGDDFKSACLPKDIDRDLLAKHVHRYVKGQSSDFFVHPRLAEFLEGELDYYLKNEFVNLWDLPDGAALLREREKCKVVGHLARAIIRLLAAVEDVQAILFEKRKFVLAAHYLAQASWLLREGGAAGRALVDEAAQNTAQVAEWRRWVGDAKASGKTLLERHPHLPIHTAHFDDDYQWRLLACFPDLTAALGGTLIHGDNYAALRTLEPAYKQGVKCIYIDPPYNTAGSEILYKNEFKEASWLSMIEPRIRQAHRILPADGAICVTIDDYEESRLSLLMHGVFGEENHLATVPIRNKPQGRATAAGFSTNHEYALFFGCGEEFQVGRLPRTGTKADRYPESDQIGAFAWANFRGTGANSTRPDRPKLYYPVYVSGEKVRIPAMHWGGDAWMAEKPKVDEVTVFPVDEASAERVWSFGNDRARREATDGHLVAKQENGKVQIYRKYRAHEEGSLPGTWWDDAKYSASESGTKVMQNLFSGGSDFDYPKSIHAVTDCLRALDLRSGHRCLDFFAGSGTTGHAVINLNREDGGQRKFILVEQGEYFDTVTLPRIAKVMTCPDWKDGQPKVGAGETAADEAPEHWSRRTLPLVQVLRLERYEDSLDALELPADRTARLAGQSGFAALDTVLHYLSDAVAEDTTLRLSTAKLTRPFDYRLPVTHEGRYGETTVDLVHTGFLLAGLHPLRLRRVERDGRPVVLAEVRPHGAPERIELVFWRDVDESLAPEALSAAAQAEYAWLAATAVALLDRSLADYACIWHNRDLLLLGGEAGRSLDLVLAERMWERA